ncbi:septum site-determining protein MinC [Acetobacter thailandicus]|uniref:Probable septum site-determining protein MinC n=1 Tax=Acetobacter thailandicus TaxID=1502842 RepID=A0ABT3QFC6_9PROT|nr:septum site-determining protein MinC [Acetobacter thailandicus]MCX2563995.1 septum site-determining protein MinC [Acetobacter thailandicus]NHN94935.1 septum formation inhibitor MinC [Acetobacter thailandicus]
MSGTPSSPRIRLSGRSFLALTLTPEAPLVDWLQALDAQISRSAGFFSGKPIILDLACLAENTPHLADLKSALEERGINIIAIENGNREWASVADWGWPESLVGGRSSGEVKIPDETTPPPPPQAVASSLLIEDPVRSGQHIVWPDGDVIILGAVASGAEISAGGSIHIYGALRGRAIAGLGGHPEARIYARVLEAELVAIDGFYATAEEMETAPAGKPTQVLLEGETLVFRAIT